MPTVNNYQNDPYASYLRKLALAESGGNAKAKNPNGSASGLYQFTESTWKGLSDKYKLGYSLDDRFDPEKSAKVARLFTQDNENTIKPILGRDLTDADRYMTHFLGAGGASNFFRVYGENPNAPISSVMSPAALKANKGVVYNKDGSLKTVGQVYQWSQKKMNITPDSITQDLIDWEKPNNNINFASEKASLYELPEQQEVKEAKQELQQKTNEQNFLEDLAKIGRQPVQQITQQEAPQQQLPPVDILGDYAQVKQFVEAPLMQQGGSIPVSSRGMYDYPNQTVIVPTDGSITMKGINIPTLGISQETGEQKMMMPDLNYFFQNTKNVIEIPLKK